MLMGQFKYQMTYQISNGAVQISRDIIKTALFLRTFQPVIIGAVQIFKSLQQNCLIFGKNVVIIGAGQILK